MGLTLRKKKAEWLPLDDRVLGLEGTFYDDEKVRGASDGEDIYKVYYVPNTFIRGFLKAIGVILLPDKWKFKTEKLLVKEHPRKFPKSMMQETKVPESDAAGRPKYKIALIRDANGHQDYQSRFKEELGQERRAAEKQKQEKEAESVREKAKRHKQRLQDGNANNGSSGGSSGGSGLADI